MNRLIKTILFSPFFREGLGVGLLLMGCLLLAACTEDDGLMRHGEATVNFSLEPDVLVSEVSPTRADVVDVAPNTRVRVLAYRRPEGVAAAVLSNDNYVGEATYEVSTTGDLVADLTSLELISGTYDFYAVTPALEVDHSGNLPTVSVKHGMDYAVSLTEGKKVVAGAETNVQLAMLQRRCALLQFNTDRKEGNENITSAQIADVTLTEMSIEPQKGIGVGELTPTTGGPAVTLTQFSSVDEDKTYQAKGELVVLPKSSSASVLKMNVSFNGKKDTVELKANLKDVVFESGKKYTFSIRFRKDSIDLLLKITPWKTLAYDTNTGNPELPMKVILLGVWTDIKYGASQGDMGNTDLSGNNSGWDSSQNNASQGGMGSTDLSGNNSGWNSSQNGTSQGGMGNADLSGNNSGWDSSENIALQGGLGAPEVPMAISGWVYKGTTLSLAELGSLNNPLKVAGWNSQQGNAMIGVGVNLSLDPDGYPATANCYIVAGSSPMSYYFDATVRGNGSTIIDCSTLPDLATATEARVLWQTGSLTSVIKDVKLVRSKVFFTTGSATEGNAVIGLFASSEINAPCLWSWHIWRLPTAPGTVNGVKTSAATGDAVNVTMMDRNLGAYNNTEGASYSFGLMYQWGRKDPFPGPSEYSTIEPSNIYGSYNNGGTSCGYWRGTYSIQVAASDATVGTEVWALKYPTIYISSASDWMFTPKEYLWGTAWAMGGVGGYNKNEGTKLIYDPCPIGYRVPPHDTWSKQTENGIYRNGGIILSRFHASLWFPAIGYRGFNNGELYEPRIGSYWTSSPSSFNSLEAGFMYFDYYAGGVSPRSNGYRAYGYPIRCVSE